MSDKAILSKILGSLRETHPELQVSVTKELDLRIVGPFETSIITVRD